MITFGYVWKLILFALTIPFLILQKKKGKRYRDIIVYIITFLYFIVLIDVLFFPIWLHRTFTYDFKASINLIPFGDIFEVISLGPKLFIRQILGNIALFVPFGFLMPMFSDKINSFKRMLILSAAASIFIEVMQMLVGILIKNPYRVADITDVILNVTGAIAGFVFLNILKKMAKPSGRPSNHPERKDA